MEKFTYSQILGNMSINCLNYCKGKLTKPQLQSALNDCHNLIQAFCLSSKDSLLAQDLKAQYFLACHTYKCKDSKIVLSSEGN